MSAAGGPSLLDLAIVSWIGGGFGVLFALMGCLQRTHRRSLSAQALWWNALVVFVPTMIAIALLILSGVSWCC